MTDQTSNSSTPPDTQIIGASWVVPVDPETLQQAGRPDNGWLADYALLVQADTIQAVGSFKALTAEHPDIPSTFLKDHILLPGLVNCHGHAGMSLLRGFADDQPLMDWLNNSIWPEESRWVSEAFVEAGSALAIAEMLLSGTTTFSDMYFFPDATASVAQRAGIRAQINFPIIEFANNWANDADQHIALGLEVSDAYRQHNLIDIGFAPHAPYTVSDSTFARVVMLAEEVDARIQIHLQETAQEVRDSLNQYGVTPVQRLNELNVLSTRTQAVHLTQFDAQDLAILQQSGTSVIHCPASNLKLASGYCNISALLDKGFHVGLGTDSAASNNSLNLFDAMRLAALLSKQHNNNAASLNASQALSLATLGGAQALGIDTITGSFKTGKQADMIAIDCATPKLQPLHQPVSQLVYADCASAVSHVWVAGQQLVKNAQLLTLNTAEVVDKARYWQQKIYSA